jgi:hypothetical protein
MSQQQTFFHTFRGSCKCRHTSDVTAYTLQIQLHSNMLRNVTIRTYTVHTYILWFDCEWVINFCELREMRALHEAPIARSGRFATFVAIPTSCWARREARERDGSLREPRAVPSIVLIHSTLRLIHSLTTLQEMSKLNMLSVVPGIVEIMSGV